MLLQRFNYHGLPLCMGCDEPILPGDFYVEVRQSSQDDTDSKLATHPGCLGKVH